MKKLFLAIALVSTFLFSCSAQSGEQATETSDSAEAPTEQAKSKSDGDREDMGHSQTSGTEQAKQSKDIHLVSPKSAEMPMGDAELVVHVEKENLTPDDVSVQVSMPMEGEADMTSLAIVEPGDKDQEFKIKTNFGMAGPWTVQVKAKDAEPATLAFNIK
ncbi:FixH family protein [Acaryochloris marina]|uniref:FixH family protein n=1 Tax=Acaryochloris marina TaxID=155978 RepID=UPI001BB09A21|nr:FixH family protein [Acaryochloris marina]QUY45807.1 FixH family protein [Acaryochloris marina S15]